MRKSGGARGARTGEERMEEMSERTWWVEPVLPLSEGLWTLRPQPL